MDKWFRRLQLVSAGAYSLPRRHDAQKTIGIIWMLLIATGYASTAGKSPPVWAIVSLLCRHWSRDYVWRLAHRQDHGSAHHQAKPVGVCAETGGR